MPAVRDLAWSDRTRWNRGHTASRTRLAAVERSPNPAPLNFAAYSAASAMQASAPATNGLEAMRKIIGTDSFSAISLPPKIGPRIEPKRPTPNAQPEPFERTEVG